MSALPRVVVAAPASGHGKTTVATGLMAALARRGLEVSGHKVGPDYIDPGYHALATGRPGRNLDPHLVGVERIVPLLLHGSRTPRAADVAVVEGVMGLFDGQIGGDGFASTAHVATLTDTPVVLVVDISSASRTIGAVVAGLAGFDPGVRVAGVILNKAGSPRHAEEVRRAVAATGIPVLGVLGRDDHIVAPSRHLGLVPAAERADAATALDRLADQVAERVDLDAVLEIARSAPPLDAPAWDPTAEVRGPGAGAAARPRVAVAGGRAFTFTYAETTELLAAAGCEVVVVDPTHDQRLPDDVQGIYLGGGFPEVHAAALSRNAALREDLRAAVAAGVPTVAECAGLLYLTETLDHAPMVGAVAATAAMSPRLTLAYRSATSTEPTLLGRPGETVTGHEFHRTRVEPAAGGTPAWVLEPTASHPRTADGFAGPTLHASYLHVHWAGHPHLAQRFADAAAAATAYRRSPGSPGALGTSGRGTSGSRELPEVPRPEVAPADPLRHHGDVETSDATGRPLVDLAVNTYDGPPPPWLADALRASLEDAGAYPDAGRVRAAQAATARHHSRADDEVLAVAGLAEAFTLVARARAWRHPVVVHPQFTEPDVALRAAGHTVHHVLTHASENFALDPSRVPEEADLVVVGNPTNPTGRVHPAATLRALTRPGRLVVVDEAFMDSVPDRRHTLADAPVPGLLVLRSLTKLWGIPGVRAGYVLGEPAVLAELRAVQTPWSVSAAAIAALHACVGPDAVAEAARRTGELAAWRLVLTRGLDELGVHHVPGGAPFVLARPGAGVRDALRADGLAVRRADTFPGLDASWVRIAARRPATTRRLLSALGVLDLRVPDLGVPDLGAAARP
ncbi:cobyrinate a,c-diamide synthase [Nocardioides zeae]|uniref:Hydrogenobyrinate a,c-diamide synthase n=1 Tax=Nocardioides imazamoxiresistens TaxID=3231893 RepID=A0ABU3PYC8_9ACTN|nr:cobyrinate a,c-diamide synthase [Nocardioides zeae]MDT9594258.1 cobyrinate a,c-diamide synthase [Nocardioides zeae]